MSTPCSSYTLPPELYEALEKRINSGLKATLKADWPLKIWSFLLNNKTHITDIKLSAPERIPAQDKFNILAELHEFLSTDWQEKDSVIYLKMKAILESIIKRPNQKITKQERYNIRKYFETTNDGSIFMTKFIDYVVSKNILTPAAELLLNPYTSILNLHEIYLHIDTKYTVSYTFQGTRHKNIVLYTDSARPPALLEPANLCELVCRACIYPYLLDVDKFPESLSLYLVEFRKEFINIAGRDELVFTSSEINTGVTDGVNVAITREEESLKTVLHELYHFYDMDYRIKHITLERELSSMLNINNKLDSLNIFEAQTELVASLINIIITTWFNMEHPASTTQTKSGLLELIKEQFIQQVIYSLYKMARVLLSSKCRAITNNSAECRITQTTNAVSYYIIKVFFYLGLADLAETCIAKDNPGFIKNDKTTRVIESVIAKGTKSILLSKIMDYLLNPQGKQYKKVIESSARMTCQINNAGGGHY